MAKQIKTYDEKTVIEAVMAQVDLYSLPEYDQAEGGDFLEFEYDPEEGSYTVSGYAEGLAGFEFRHEYNPEFDRGFVVRATAAFIMATYIGGYGTYGAYLPGYPKAKEVKK